MPQNNVIHQLEGNVPQFAVSQWQDGDRLYVVADYVDADYVV